MDKKEFLEIRAQVIRICEYLESVGGPRFGKDSIPREDEDISDFSFLLNSINSKLRDQRDMKNDVWKHLLMIKNILEENGVRPPQQKVEVEKKGFLKRIFG